MDRREREALDRHITGNYGEDQFAHFLPEADDYGAADYDDPDGFDEPWPNEPDDEEDSLWRLTERE